MFFMPIPCIQKSDTSDDEGESMTALPKQTYLNKDSQLVVQSKDKEQIYTLADKIIMKEIDECIIRQG